MRRIMEEWITVFFVLVLLGSFDLFAGTASERVQKFTTDFPLTYDFSNSTGGKLVCSANLESRSATNWKLSDGSPVTNVVKLRHTTSDGSLVFPPFAAEDYRQDVHGVSYRCAASNALGILVSIEIRVRGVVAQAFDIHVYDAYTIRGNSAVMKCQVPKFLQPYTNVTAWIKDSVISITNVNLDSNSKYIVLPSGDLIIKDVDSSDSHTTYRCQVIHKLTGQVKTSLNSGRLIVTDSDGKVPPKVIFNLQEVTVRQNKNIFIPCVGSGLPVPKYSWQKQMPSGQLKDIAINGRFNAVAGLLIIQNAQQSDTGTYICTVTNDVNYENSVTEVTVLDSLKVSLDPPKAVVDAGAATNLTCKIFGAAVFSISWTKDGKPLPLEGVYQLNNETIHIPKMYPQLAGIYQCFVQNDAFSSFGAAIVKLGDSLPVILKGFEEQIHNIGDNAKMQCIANGNPLPEFHWTLDNVAISANSRIHIENKVIEDTETQSVLEIYNANVEDGGVYRCIVKSRAGQISFASRINIRGKLGMRQNVKFYAVEEGDVQIDCPLYGYPIQDIQWEKDGYSLPIDLRQVLLENNTLIISNVQRHSDSGQYTCIAKGSEHQRIQGDVELIVMVPPKITPFSFQDDLIREGARAQIQCVVSEGDSPFYIKWLKNGQMLLQEQGITIRDLDEFSSTLMISSISPRHNGNYTCVVHNAAGVTQHMASLFVNVPPRILPFAFQDDQFFKGMRAHIICAVSQGDLPIQFKWFKDGHNIPQSLGIFTRGIDNHSNSLSIESVSSMHTGNYTCIANNAAASVSHSAQLLVQVAPKITPFSFRNSLREGSMAKITCMIYQGDLPITLQWFHDHTPATHFNNTNVLRVDDYTSILTIENVQMYHTGNYTCIANNSAAVTQYSALLVVYVRPRWITKLHDQVLKSGSDLIMNCEAEGFPIPTITWKKMAGDSVRNRNSIENVEEDEHLMVFSNGTLAFRDVQRSYEGQYLCIASNGVGVPISHIISIKVQAAPEFDQSQQEVISKKGEEVKISCEAAGDWPIHYQWSTNKQIIQSNKGNQRYKIQETQDETNKRSVSILQIIWVDRKDSTVFTCHAKNEFGESEMQFILTVQEYPEAPVIEMPLKVINQSIELNWSIQYDGNTKILRYIIQYKKGVDRWTERVNTLNIPGSRVSAKIPNLNAATTYSFRMLAENRIGNSSYSEEVSAKTDETVPNGAPESVDVESMDANTLRLTWKPPKKNLWNGAIRGYNVGYKIFGVADEYTFAKLEVPEDYTEELIYQLIDLKMYTQYNIIVQAYNSKGNGPNSEAVLAMTSEDVPSNPPDNVRCSSLSSKSIYVLWDSPAPETINGILRGFKVLYKPVEEWFDAMIQTQIVPLTKLTINELNVNTNYSIQILAFTKMGDGVKSEAVFCKTHEDVPEPPKAIKVLPSSSDSVVVTWKPPQRSNGILVKYNVYYKSIENGQEVDINSQQTEELIQNANVHQSSINTQHIELKGLKKNKKYAFWVTASSAIGESSGSTIVAQTVADSIIAAKTASFDAVIKTPWKEDIVMPCLAVGVPPPNKKWTFGNQVLKESNRLKIGQDGSVIINKISTEDSGNYTCAVYNEYGRDEVSYFIAVQVPPSAPTLDIVSKTRSSIKIQWKPGHTAKDNIKGYLLHYKQDNGAWNNIEIRSDQSLHTLDKLSCGSTYQVYMEAFNNIGTGAPCDTITITTDGSDVVAPSKEKIIREGSSFITVHLDAWPSSGCPVKNFAVEYKALNGREWISVGISLRPSQKKLVISGLVPSTWYILRVTAESTSSPTMAEYRFATHTVSGGTVPPETFEESIAPVYIFYLDPLIFIPAVALLIVIIIALMVVCVYFKRRTGHVETSDSYDNTSQMNAWIRNSQTLPRDHFNHPLFQATLSRQHTKEPSPYATSHLTDHFHPEHGKFRPGYNFLIELSQNFRGFISLQDLLGLPFWNMNLIQRLHLVFILNHLMRMKLLSHSQINLMITIPLQWHT